VGVYRDTLASAAVERALAGLGVEPEKVHVGDEQGRLASLQAEMRQESEDAYIAPQAGIAFPKEATKSSLLLGPLFVLAGGLLAFPFSFIPIGEVSFWVRCFWIVLSGMAAGGAVAAIVIPALSVKSALEPSAAQRGIVVRVEAWSPEIEAAMEELRPVRLDRLGGNDFPLGTVTTEEEHAPGGAVDETFANLKDELRAAPEKRQR
jgi:hypothetical protein